MRLRLFHLVACVIGLCLWAQPAAAYVDIELKSQAAVAGAEVTLGDIAALKSDDFKLLATLTNLPLGAAPLPGHDATLDRATITHWLNARLGYQPDGLAWHGAQEVHIQTATAQLDGAQVDEQATRVLKAWLAPRATRSSVAVRDPSPMLTVPAGAVDLHVRPLPVSTRITPGMTLWVEVSVNHHFVRSVPVTFVVEAWGEAYTADVSTAQDATLDPAHLRKTEVALAGLPGDVLAAAELQHPLRLRHAVAAGAALLRTDVEPRPLVARGDHVLLHTAQGSAVQLQQDAEALQDGLSGQRIMVRTAGTQATLLAWVRAPGQVELGEEQ